MCVTNRTSAATMPAYETGPILQRSEQRKSGIVTMHAYKAASVLQIEEAWKNKMAKAGTVTVGATKAIPVLLVGESWPKEVYTISQAGEGKEGTSTGSLMKLA